MAVDEKIVIDEELEKRQIKNAYRALLRSAKKVTQKEELKKIRKAFEFAVDAHKNVRRKSGELYIFHPISVARIVSDEMGLGATAIVCALLHDTVEDTTVSLDDIEREFGKTVRKVIDGLTKIAEFSENTSSIQAENFKNLEELTARTKLSGLKNTCILIKGYREDQLEKISINLEKI